MVITFDKIKVTNFFSFEEVEVNLDRGGYVLVSGINENPVDNAISNGSGKSSLFDAVIWCLTGNTIRECKNVSNINADNGAKVTLYFSVDRDKYEITRTKDYKPLGTTLKIIYNGQDVSGKGIRDTEKILQEYLPDLTASFLGSVIILGQGLPQRFSNNTPSGRKDVLEKLSQSDFMINELTDKVSKRRSVLSNNLDEIKNNISYLVGQQKVREESLQSTQQEVQELETFRPNANSYLDDCLSARDFTKSNFEKLKLELEVQQAKLTEAEKDCQSIKSSISEIKTNRLLKENNFRNEFDGTISPLNIEIKQLEREIKTLSSITDVCPTCGQKLIGVEKPDISPLQEALTKKQSLLQATADEKAQKLKALQECDTNNESELQQKLTTCISLTSELTRTVNQSKQDLDNSQAKYINAERVYNEALSKVNSLELNITEKQQAISKLKGVLSELSEKILYNINEQKDMEERLSVIAKMSTALKRDFRGYLLTNVIDYIAKRAKYYSLQVFGNDNIGFSLEGNAIEISFDGKEYANLSGGEKQRVDLIIQLSIRDMLCCFMGFSSNIIVLDEFVDGLDSAGCEQVLNLIAKNLSDVGTVYIITHHASIAIPTDDEITIVKGPDKISRIRE